MGGKREKKEQRARESIPIVKNSGKGTKQEKNRPDQKRAARFKGVELSCGQVKGIGIIGKSRSEGN